jgi:serine/threonine protein kinase
MNIYGLYEDQKHFYVVAELIKGQELFVEFKQRKQFPEDEAFDIFKQVVLCLSYLHKNKVMHRYPLGNAGTSSWKT